MSSPVSPATEARRLRPAQVVVAMTAVAVYLPVIVSSGLRTDAGAHLRFAQSMALTGREFGPYYLFQQLTIILRALIPFGALSKIVPSLGDRATIWDMSGTMVLLGCVAALAVMLQSRLSKDVEREGHHRAQLLAGVLTIALLVATPVTVLTWVDHQLVVGYISVTTYSSATVLVARPFALGLFWVAASRLWTRQTNRVVASTALLTLVSIHAKPSYIVCLLPALAIEVAWTTYRRRPVDVRMWWLGLVVPSVVGLGYQFLVSRGQGGVGIAPFEVIRQMLNARGMTAWWFLALLGMSVLFPVVVVCAEFDTARSSRSLRLAWLAFVIGMVLFCTFTITGRSDHGDLLWGPQIGLFVVFVESLRVALSARIRRSGAAARDGVDVRTVLLGVVFAVHVACGAVLWYHELVEPAAWW